MTPFFPDNVVLMSSLFIDTDVFSAGFRWRLFPLASLSFGISFSWDLLLTFSLDTFFLVFFCFHMFFLWGFFLLKLLSLEGPSVLTSPLSWGDFSFSCLSRHLFLLASIFQSTSQYYKVPILLCSTKLHQTLSSTTLHYKACTKHFPVILCTAKLAQSSNANCKPGSPKTMSQRTQSSHWPSS